MRPGISPTHSRLRQAGRSAISSSQLQDFPSEPESNAALAEACYDNLRASRQALQIARNRSQATCGRSSTQSSVCIRQGNAMIASLTSPSKATPVYARAAKSLEEAALQTSLSCMRSQCWVRDRGAGRQRGLQGVFQDEAFAVLEAPKAPWECPFCTRMNAVTALRCRTCGNAYRRMLADSSAQQAQHAPWRCTTCGNQNIAGTETCAVCQVGWRVHANRFHGSRPHQ